MATAIQFLRSSEISLRPNPITLSDGMPMWNSNSIDPGLYLRSNTNTLLKVGPTLVSSTAPNAAPLGFAGNCIGEMWFDTSINSRPLLKVWDGSAWASSAINIESLIPGTGITGAAYNGQVEQTWSVIGESANIPNTLVQRDAVGDFAAGTITAALTGDVSGTATNAENVEVQNEAGDTACRVLFATSPTGVQGCKTNAALTFNSFSGALTATSLGIASKISLANLGQPPGNPSIGDLACIAGTLQFYTSAGWKTVTVT